MVGASSRAVEVWVVSARRNQPDGTYRPVGYFAALFGHLLLEATRIGADLGEYGL